MIKGLAVATILLMGALVSPIPISYAQTTHSSNFASIPLAISEVQEFGQGVVLMYSSTSSAVEIITMKLSSLSATDITNLGQSVSEVAQLHKTLAHEDKTEKNAFKILFHQFRNAVKAILGIGQGVEENQIKNELKKTEIKINAQISKIEEKEDRENKIKTATQLIKQKKDLQKIRNKKVTLEDFRYNGDDKDKKLEELQAEERKLLKKILIQEANQNGKKLTGEDLKKIDQEVKKKTTSSNSGNDGDKDNKGNDNSGKGSDKGSSDKGKSDKGSSDKGKSDKGNSSKSKGGNGKSKK